MTLQAVRKQFTLLSGRFDLVEETTSFRDKGADFYIKAGQRWLDRSGEIAKAQAVNYQNLAQGSWYALIPQARSLREVWMSNADGDKWKLEKKNLEDIRWEFKGDPAALDEGTPSLWTPISVREIPRVSGQTVISEFGTTVYSESVNNDDYLGLMFLAPCDEAITLETHGLFYQPTLVNDTDTNYWTESQEHVLVWAALRALEISYRNTEGARDWEDAIRKEVVGLEFDFADEEVSEYQQMEG